MKPSGKLKVRVVPQAQLNRRELDQMWELYKTYYVTTDRNDFETGIHKDSFLFLCYEKQSGDVKGFIRGLIIDHNYRGEKVWVFYTGDTILQRDYWGQHVFRVPLMRKLLSWKLRHPFSKMFWFNPCSGWRGYLAMARACPTLWPDPGRRLPDWEKGLLDLVAQWRYGSKWKPELGVVVEDQAPLYPDFSPPPPELSDLPEVKFFLRANPDYGRGDELGLLGKIDWRFFMRFCTKLVGQRLTAVFRKPARVTSTKSPAGGQT